MGNAISSFGMCFPKKKTKNLELLTFDPSSTLNYDNAWKWMACCTERKFKRNIAALDMATISHLAEGEIQDIHSYVPAAIHDAIFKGKIREEDEDFDIIIKKCHSTVMFCDASGFTAMTERLSTRPDGAEMLSKCINSFFFLVIDTIREFNGDIIKFSGDAITVIWPYETGDVEEGYRDAEEEQCEQDERDYSKSSNTNRVKFSDEFISPSNTNTETEGGVKEEEVREKESTEREGEERREEEGGEERRVVDDQETAIKKTLYCCHMIHERLKNFASDVTDISLTMHIGVGVGSISILQVGGVLDRWEYVVAGDPLRQISVAEPLAHSGETVISPEVHGVIDSKNLFLCEPVASNPSYQKLLSPLLSSPLLSPPPPPSLASSPSLIPLYRRFIPPSVFLRTIQGSLSYLEEMRTVSVIFLGVKHLNVATKEGAKKAQSVMVKVQKAVYAQEGSVNKFLVDDKGVLLLAVFGLSPLHHIDDPSRAVISALRMVHTLRVEGLTGSIGVSTGRVWCGIVGNSFRKEFTVLGDVVNLSARLMAHAASSLSAPSGVSTPAGTTPVSPVAGGMSMSVVSGGGGGASLSFPILVDSTTAQLCQHKIELVKGEEITVKGKGKKVLVYRPTGEIFARSNSIRLLENLPLVNWRDWRLVRRLERRMGCVLPEGFYRQNKMISLVNLSGNKVAVSGRNSAEEAVRNGTGKENMSSSQARNLWLQELERKLLGMEKEGEERKGEERRGEVRRMASHFSSPSTLRNQGRERDTTMSLFPPGSLGGIGEMGEIGELGEMGEMGGEKRERRKWDLSTVGGVLYIQSSNEDASYAAPICNHILQTMGYRAIHGCNKGDFECEYVDNFFENLPLLAIQQIFGRVLNHIRFDDFLMRGIERNINEILMDLLPANQQETALYKIKELSKIFPSIFKQNRKNLVTTIKKPIFDNQKAHQKIKKKLEKLNRTKYGKGILALQDKQNPPPPPSNHSSPISPLPSYLSSPLSPPLSSPSTFSPLLSSPPTGEEDDPSLSSHVIDILLSLLQAIAKDTPIHINLHVRTGTSVFSYVDTDTWAVALAVAKLAYRRRQYIIEVLESFENVSDIRRCLSEIPPPIILTLYTPGNSIISETSADSPADDSADEYLSRPSNEETAEQNSRINSSEKEILELARKSGNSIVKLEPLRDEAEVERYLAFVYGVDEEIPLDVIRYVFSLAGGIPYLVELLFNHLVSEGYIEVVGERREGDMRDGDATRRVGERGEAIRREGDATWREGDATQREEDATKREGDATRREGRKGEKKTKCVVKKVLNHTVSIPSPAVTYWLVLVDTLTLFQQEIVKSASLFEMNFGADFLFLFFNKKYNLSVILDACHHLCSIFVLRQMRKGEGRERRERERRERRERRGETGEMREIGEDEDGKVLFNFYSEGLRTVVVNTTLQKQRTLIEAQKLNVLKQLAPPAPEVNTITE